MLFLGPIDLLFLRPWSIDNGFLDKFRKKDLQNRKKVYKHIFCETISYSKSLDC